MLTQQFPLSKPGFVVLVGENGAGKSRLLVEVAESRVRRGRPVAAICNSVFELMNLRGRYFSKMSPRQGRRYVETIVKHSIVDEVQRETSNLPVLMRALRYGGYDGALGVQFVDLSPENGRRTKEAKEEEGKRLTRREHDTLSMLDNMSELIQKWVGPSTTVWIDEEQFLERLFKFPLLDLMAYERELKSLKVVKSIRLVVRKDGDEFGIDRASSGELLLLGTWVFASGQARSGAVLLIDEPETSMHPRWQAAYLSRFWDIVYLYGTSVAVATHSPLIVSGAKTSDVPLRVFQVSNGEARAIGEIDANIDEALYNVFGVLSPESAHVTDEVESALTALEQDIGRIDDTIDTLERLREAAYDSRQSDLLEAAASLARKFASSAEGSQ